MKRISEKFYVIAIGLLFAALAIVFCTFPRSKFSELEKRELAKFPEFTPEALASGEYFGQIGIWFSDSEPYRDLFMASHMQIKDLMGLKIGGEEAITFHANSRQKSDSPAIEDEAGNAVAEIDEGNAKVADAGIIVVGKPPKARALMNFGGVAAGQSPYAKTLNRFAAELPSVNVYACIIPTAIAYYCPQKIRNPKHDQKAVINHIYSQLNPKVHKVDIFTALDNHKGEEIYLRTDHHWSPLGGYYAAKELARAAKVNFPILKSYDKKVTHGMVGSMYGYSKDIAVKQSPEDFIYYTPRGVNYQTYYIDFKTDKDYHVISEGPMVKGQFFHHFPDGSGGAYCTMMGSDQRITKVVTPAKTNRKIAIIKDSFGNAIPGYLFSSFREVHVLDYRYFPRNLRQYIKDNGITDLAICVNIFSAYSQGISERISKMLDQPNHIVAPAKKSESGKGKAGKSAHTQKSGSQAPASQPSGESRPAEQSAPAEP